MPVGYDKKGALHRRLKKSTQKGVKNELLGPCTERKKERTGVQKGTGKE